MVRDMRYLTLELVAGRCVKNGLGIDIKNGDWMKGLKCIFMRPM